MRLIACVDDRDGMAFHQRRQSRDRVVRSPAPWLDRLEEVRLYRWGRVYPADVWLGLDLADGWALVSQEQFPGWSHDTITKEVYRR